MRLNCSTLSNSCTRETSYTAISNQKSELHLFRPRKLIDSILLDENMRIKITDFGSAKIVGRDAESQGTFYNQCLGNSLTLKAKGKSVHSSDRQTLSVPRSFAASPPSLHPMSGRLVVYSFTF